MSDETLDRHVRSYPAGTVLFREGQPGREMYVVSTGQVELTRRLGERETIVAVVPPGEFFGEMALLNGRPRSATATVIADARLLVIDGNRFDAMIRSRGDIAVRIIRLLAARLDQANHQIELLMVRDANHRVVEALRRAAETVGASTHEGAAVFIPMTLAELAGRTALDEDEVALVVGRLEEARLVMPAEAAGYDAVGFVIPEVGRLVDFLEFLEMRERFAVD